MTKRLLLSCLTVLLGVFATYATTLKITVDNANNVSIVDGNGYGTALTLIDGLNTFEATSSQNPFVIKANEGAEIVSVVYNDNDLAASYDGTYRFGVGGPETTVEITTTGSGVPPTPQVKYTAFNVYAVGDGITGAPFKLTYDKDGEWVVPEPGDYGMAYKVPENATIKITPVAPYEIVSLTLQTAAAPMEVTRNDDGSVTFPNTIPDFYSVTLEMKIADNAVGFSIQVDYPGNLAALLEWGRTGEHAPEALDIKSGVNKFHIVAEASPLALYPVSGGEILQVVRNGEVAAPIGWEGSGGYVFFVEDGDEFSISTKGPEIEVKVNASSYNTASLQDYFFTRGDGSVVKLEGKEASIKGNQGEYIYVSGRPGTDYQMLMGSNGCEYDMTNWKDWFRLTPGADKENPASVTIYGNRNISGVIVDVDDASRVKVLQQGGRGEQLSLVGGKNNFALADLVNALAVSATAGNQVTSVTLNGDLVEVNAQGLFLVNVEEGDYVQVRSRKEPTDVDITLSLNTDARLDWLDITVNGQSVESVSPLRVISYSTVNIYPAPGYVIDFITSSNDDMKVSEIDNGYSIYLASADFTAAILTISVSEMEPAEGNAIVIPNGDPLLVAFSELEYIADEDRYARVKTLTNNTVNEVKIGNYVMIYRKDSQTQYRYIKVNGTDIEDVSSRSITVEVKGRTVIDTEVYSPVYVYSTDTFDNSKHVKMGIIEFEVNGQRVKEFYAEPGMTVKFIPVVNDGYIFEYLEKFYPTTMAADGIRIDSDTYTFTEDDCKNEFLLFKGVFKNDDNNPVYVVRGSTAWLVDKDGNIPQDNPSALGNVVILNADGNYVSEITGYAGDRVQLEISVNDQSIFDNYEVAGFCLMSGFPNSVVPSPYTINPDDADASGVIFIVGLIREKDSGIESIYTDGLTYDAATGVITSNNTVRIFSVTGTQVLEAANGVANVSSLPAGLYIAVSGDKTIKFVK